ELLGYLQREDLLPSRTFTLVERAPFQGPLKLLRDSGLPAQFIGLEVAKSIFVSPCPEGEVPNGLPRTESTQVSQFLRNDGQEKTSTAGHRTQPKKRRRKANS